MKLSKAPRLSKFIPLLFAALLALPIAAQTARPPERVAEEFYRWYFSELNAGREPREQRAKIRASVSARLSKWFFSPAYSDWGADYFIDAQDYESGWSTALTAAKVSVNGRRALVKVRLPFVKGSGFPARTLSLVMIKEGNAWKIDRVNGRAFPAR